MILNTLILKIMKVRNLFIISIIKKKKKKIFLNYINYNTNRIKINLMTIIQKILNIK